MLLSILSLNYACNHGGPLKTYMEFLGQFADDLGYQSELHLKVPHISSNMVSFNMKQLINIMLKALKY